MVLFVEVALDPVVVTPVVEVVLVVTGITVVEDIGDDVANDGMEIFSVVLIEVIGAVSPGANVVNVVSSHSWVGQHSPIGGATSMQSTNGGGRHSLTAQDNSPSTHWHL